MKSDSGLVVRGCFVLTASAGTRGKGAAHRTYEVDQVEWGVVPASEIVLVDSDEPGPADRHGLSSRDKAAWVANWHFVLPYRNDQRDAQN